MSIPPIVVSSLTAIGIAFAEKAIEVTVEKLSKETEGYPKDKLKDSLSVGYVTKFSKKVYYNLNRLLAEHKNISLSDIRLAVLSRTNPNNSLEHSKSDKEEIKALYKIEKKHLAIEIDDILEKYHREVSEEPIKQVITEQVENLNTDTLTSIEDDEMFLAGQRKPSANKAVESVKNTIHKVGNTINEVKDAIDTYKDPEKFRLLIEIVDLTRDYSSAENNQADIHQQQQILNTQQLNNIPYNTRRGRSRLGVGYQNQLDYSNPHMYQQINGVQQGYGTQQLKLVHIYKDKKYLRTINEIQFLEFFINKSQDGEFIIRRIETINTVKNEFRPSNRWKY